LSRIRERESIALGLFSQDDKKKTKEIKVGFLLRVSQSDKRNLPKIEISVLNRVIFRQKKESKVFQAFVIQNKSLK